MAHRSCVPSRIGVLIVLSMIAGGAWNSVGAQELQDVVYLKDGSVIRGTIVEQIPSQSILIETLDGNRFRYVMDQIERIARERAVATPNQSSHQMVQRPPKSPGAALGLSLLIAGGGQAYNGEWGKGAGFFLGAVVMGSAAVEALNSDECVYNEDCSTAGLYMLGWIGVALWSVVDAYQGAKRINQQAGFAALEFMPRNGVRLARASRQGERGVQLTMLRWHP